MKHLGGLVRRERLHGEQWWGLPPRDQRDWTGFLFSSFRVQPHVIWALA
jgi:hypothetical protein